MRTYEVVYIFSATLDEAAVTERLERHQAELLESGGEVLAVDHWGVRQLAYPIAKSQTAYYVVAHVNANPDGLPPFERRLKLDEDLLRYLLVLHEGQPSNGRSILVDGGEEGSEEESSSPSDDASSSRIDAPVVQESRKNDDEDEEDDDASVPEADAGPRANLSGPPEFSGGRGRRRRVEGPAIEVLNYKDVSTLSKFVTEQGKLLPKRTTKVTAGFQRKLGRAIKRARYLALLPYVQEHEV